MNIINQLKCKVLANKAGLAKTMIDSGPIDSLINSRDLCLTNKVIKFALKFLKCKSR